jgi:TetR/AcrR family transcriptional regulator
MVAHPRRVSTRKPTHLRREEIADVAMRILAREGHRKLTTKYLAAEVGLTEGAIFRHFASMEAIAGAIVDRMGEALLPSVAGEDPHPLRRLEGFFRHRAAMLLGKPELGRLLLSDELAHAAGEAQATRVAAFRQKSQRFVMECLAQAREKRFIDDEVSLAAAARLTMGALMSLGHGGAFAGSPEESIDQLWRLIERALRGKEAAR